MAKTDKKIDVGSEVRLVLASGKLAPAKVTKVRGGDRQLVDLEADLGGDAPVVITSSPLDETGKRPDCWLPVPAVVETPKA